MKRKVWIKEFKHVIRVIVPLSSYSFRYQNVSSFITCDKKQMFVLISQRKVNQNIEPCESKKAIKLDERHIRASCITPDFNETKHCLFCLVTSEAYS